MSGFYSPNAKKDTLPVVMDIYKDYDANAPRGEGLSNHILTTSSSMPADKFKGGAVTLEADGGFSAQNPYV